jgi:imidazolonepropionase-like amidohydrolase
MKYLTLLSLLTITVLTACSAISTTTASKSIYSIREVTVIDVKNGVAVPAQTVIVVNDRIDQIGAQGTIKIPRSAKAIDGHGLYLMPGLVDAHVHYLDAPVFGRLMIANGVLLVRDMGMPNEYILPIRDQLNRGETLGPEMIATGWILDGDPPIIPSISLGLKTSEEGRAAVRAQVEAGVDMIKVYSKLDKEVFLAIVDEAQKSGLKVVGHVPEEIYIEDAAAAGQQSIEHLFGFERVIGKSLGEQVKLTFTGLGSDAGYFSRFDEVDPKDLESVYLRLRASGVTICPTILVFKTGTHISAIKSGNYPQSEYISPMFLDSWKLQWTSQENLPDFIWQNWAQMVKGLNDAGVPLMVGTDLSVPGILPGFSVHEEMAVWQEAGIPPADILRSATLVPVQFMDRQDRLGSIEEDKTASMILVRGNPLEDVQNAQNIEGVLLRGEYFNRQALDQMLREARDLAQNSHP